MRAKLFVGCPIGLAVAVGLAIAGFTVWPAPASGGGALTITVNTATATETNDGLCSLPEAIIASNTNADYLGCLGAGGTFGDRIVFSLPGVTPVINVTTELPTITERVTILGGDNKVELRGPGGTLVSGQDGLTVNALGTVITGLVVNNFRDVGILILGNNVQVFNNYIGTDATGTVAQPNAGYGVQVKGNLAGLHNNLISGNAKEGILVDITAQGTVITGNRIGTNASGTEALMRSEGAGVRVKGMNTKIGGTNNSPESGCVAYCNLIGGSSIGIHVSPPAVGTTIVGNFIGLDVTGTGAVSDQGGIGVFHEAEHTIIGGFTSAERNIISGHSYGIYGLASKLFIHGNYIGTDAAGLEAIPNGVLGIRIEGGDSVLITAGNVISGNGGGVQVVNATIVKIEGNFIGTDSSGLSPLSNVIGIDFAGSHGNSVGNETTPNRIAFNQIGIHVRGQTATGNLITANSIHDNSTAGIENENGGNAELAPPVISDADANGASGTSCPNCIVEVFSDSRGEGETFEGRTTADANGDWSLTETLAGPNVTATARDAAFNTSEFSEPFVIFEPTPSPSPSPSGSPTPTVIQGDFDCNEQPDIEDASYLLEYLAQLIDGDLAPPCPDIGDLIYNFEWGDVNCDGTIDLLDVLYMFRFVAELASTPEDPTCVPVGGPTD